MDMKNVIMKALGKPEQNETSKNGMLKVILYLKENEVSMTIRTDLLSKDKVLLRFEKSIFRRDFMMDLPTVQKENVPFEQLVMNCAESFVSEILAAETAQPAEKS